MMNESFNIAVALLQTFHVFYLIYVFHETFNQHYVCDTNCVTRYGIGGGICLFTIFIVPLSLCKVVYMLILILFPLLIYMKKDGWIQPLAVWYALLFVSLCMTIMVQYFVSIIPVQKMPFTFTIHNLYLNVLTIFMFLYLRRSMQLNEFPYIVILNIGFLILCVMDILFFYESKVDVFDNIRLLPTSLSLCFLALFRLSYAMESSKDNILNLTIQRYADKENKEKYEAIEKENRMVMQQLHDMKKHLRILEEMHNSEDDFTSYRNAMEEKAEAILNYKQTGNVLIDHILQTYQSRFKQANIQYNIEIDKIDFTFMNTIDLSALIANLLDNAIESARRCKERFLLLKIKEQRGIIIVKMKNSCLDIMEENGELKSMKSDLLYHGYGMRNIAMIAHKYGGDLKYRFDQENQVFITTISLFPYR